MAKVRIIFDFPLYIEELMNFTFYYLLVQKFQAVYLVFPVYLDAFECPGVSYKKSGLAFNSRPFMRQEAQ